MRSRNCFKVKYSSWKNRIIPLLELCGLKVERIDEKTYLVNREIGYRFEYRYYGHSAPVWIGETEVVE